MFTILKLKLKMINHLPFLRGDMTKFTKSYKNKLRNKSSGGIFFVGRFYRFFPHGNIRNIPPIKVYFFFESMIDKHSTVEYIR